MRSRDEIHESFVARFHSGKRKRGVSNPQLDDVNAALKTKLPTAYRQFMQRHGAIYTPSLLDLITDKKADRPDIQEFFTPKQVVTNTKMYWSGGMPEDVIGFASDCMGNMIGFKRHEEESDDAPVVFFDHDYVEVSEIARGFDELLVWHLDNL